MNLLNRLFTREQVVEIYQIPAYLIEEVFRALKPFSGGGVSALYLESLVDRQIHQYFEQKSRLRDEVAGLSSQKEEPMSQTWADTVADAKQVAGEMLLERLLVDENEAALMLGVSRRKVFDLNHKGELPCRMVGSRKMYCVKKLREFSEGRCE